MKHSGNQILVTIKFTAIICLFAAAALGQNICTRPQPGAAVAPPAELVSKNGTLELNFFFRSSLDAYGLTRYCYVTADGVQSPTLRVNPGDSVILHFTNQLKAEPKPQPAMPADCAGAPLSAQATNLHFHGLAIPPTCHQDDVLNTLIAPGSATFDYRFTIPANQPPGLYWYHPHPHGFTEAQVLGGASGALIVNGIERFRPEISGLTERLLILRDQLQPGEELNYMEPGEEQGKDVSLNFVPITAPLLTPAIINMHSGEREFWRVLNASADTYFDLQLSSSNIQLIALDGSPLRQPLSKPGILLSPGARAEFIVTAPPATAQFFSKRYETGPLGEDTPPRILATVISSRGPAKPASRGPFPAPSQLADLTPLVPARTRHLYLSEDRSDIEDPTLLPRYFITEEGKQPKIFDMMSTEPDITATQGTTEDWIIENRAAEAHTFHIHQLHFQLLARDGRPVPQPFVLDTIDLPFWDGKGPYPNVKLRMDFRSPLITGDFVYHCHILEHEDHGMMGRIRVLHGQ